MTVGGEAVELFVVWADWALLLSVLVPSKIGIRGVPVSIEDVGIVFVIGVEDASDGPVDEALDGSIDTEGLGDANDGVSNCAVSIGTDQKIALDVILVR